MSNWTVKRNSQGGILVYAPFRRSFSSHSEHAYSSLITHLIPYLTRRKVPENATLPAWRINKVWSDQEKMIVESRSTGVAEHLTISELKVWAKKLIELLDP